MYCGQLAALLQRRHAFRNLKVHNSMVMLNAKYWHIFLWRTSSIYPGGGGGGLLGIYIGEGVPWHTKKGGGGGLRCGHNPKRGVLGTGTAPKKGVLGCGHNQKKGGLRHVYNPKKGEFKTDFVKREGVRNWSCSKGGLGSLFIYYLYFYLSIWSTSGGVFWQVEKGGS